MELSEGFTLNLEVSTNAGAFEIVKFNAATNSLKVRVKSPPEKGKANVELEKKLSKAFKAPVRIVSGRTSKRKKVRVEGNKLKVVTELSVFS